MLLLSIAFSLMLWIMLIRAALSSRMDVAAKVTGAFLFFLIAGTLTSCLLPAVMLQTVLTLVVYGICRWFNWTPRRFAILATGAMLASYGVASWLAYTDLIKLQNKYPVVSMEPRLPIRPENSIVPKLPETTLSRLTILEKELESRERKHAWVGPRHDYLQSLHENTTAVFISQPGFGSARMTAFRSYAMRGRQRLGQPPVRQPGVPAEVVWSPGTFSGPILQNHSERLEKSLLPIHEQSELDFLDPISFGYIRDRKFVVGFESHEMQQVPTVPADWELRTVSLIGLILHDEPVVYVSGNLPNMEELRKTPTVPIDDFEAAGLERLRAGDDLFAHEQAGVLRAVGALRSTKQCVQCHGGQRGELLGAFSYNIVLKSQQK